MTRRHWTAPLAAWYRDHGRHQLPWRHTTDPWAILVSELMLQQTSVARVSARWPELMERWPTAAAWTAVPLGDILRAWQGMGYPRRARALHDVAGYVTRHGWPADEAGLRQLPGIGDYTARALRILAFGDHSTPPPRDVNVARVAARVVAGLEVHELAPTRLAAILAATEPVDLGDRDHVYALFDVGALHCRAQPRCRGCPLAAKCASVARLAGAPPPPPPRRQPAYATSMRRLRGAILKALLAPGRPGTLGDLEGTMAGIPAAARPGAVGEALLGLRADGLLAGVPVLPGESLGADMQ